jgi:hypothetical protein
MTVIPSFVAVATTCPAETTREALITGNCPIFILSNRISTNMSN